MTVTSFQFAAFLKSEKNVAAKWEKKLCPLIHSNISGKINHSGGDLPFSWFPWRLSGLTQVLLWCIQDHSAGAKENIKRW